MLPTDNGLTAYSPEAYAAIAVEDLLKKTDKDALHAIGAPSEEYLGILALYALRRSVTLFSGEMQSIGKAFKLASDTFNPFHMSGKLMIHHLTFINATDYIRKPGNSIANQYGKINNNGRPQATPRYIFSVRLYISTRVWDYMSGVIIYTEPALVCIRRYQLSCGCLSPTRTTTTSSSFPNRGIDAVLAQPDDTTSRPS